MTASSGEGPSPSPADWSKGDWGGSASDEVRLARAYLSRVAEPASRRLWEFVAAEGPVAAADAIRRQRVDAAVASATLARHDNVDPQADLTAADHHGIRLVTPEDADWPHLAVGALDRALRQRSSLPPDARGPVEPVPPLALWVAGNGDVASLGTRSVAVVGARAATAYGEHVAADIAHGLARRGVVVVSGGAFGIDAVAHRAALAAGGETVLVSAGGLDRPYPPANASLYARARESGLLISESPPGRSAQRQRFLTRNRLIAAFGYATVIVEAARRSGAASTAGHCFRIGRPVMAVPGPVTSPMSAGCHELLRRVPESAILVTGVLDVLDVVGTGIAGRERVADHAGVSGGSGSSGVPGVSDGPGTSGGPVGPAGDGGVAAVPAGSREVLDALDPLSRQVYEGLSRRRTATVDSVARRAGVSVLEVMRSLPTLDLAGLLEVDDGGYRARTP